MNKAAKTYMLQFGGSMALYVIVLFASRTFMRSAAETAWRIPIAILPLIPITLGIMAFLRFFRNMDEMQKRIQFEALAFSFAATGLLTFSYGLMQNAGLPELSFTFVFPLMIVLWGLGALLAARRYA